MKRSLFATFLLLAILLPSRLAAGQAAPGSLDDQLLSAARNGDMAAVQQLIQQGVNIEAKDSADNTALIYAAGWGRTDVVKLLLEKGANIEARDAPRGWTALINAAWAGHDDVINLLLEKGANIEAKEIDDPFIGDTALIRASEEGHAEMVRFLLEKGANIEARNKDGYTALMVAAEYGKPEVVKVLLEKGANLEAKHHEGPFGHTALQFAVIQREFEIVRLLQQAIAQDPRTNLAESLDEFQQVPSDDAKREKVIHLAAALPTFPPIPQEARQLGLQASALMKQTSALEELWKPIELLRNALVIAPWWGNAYYDLSRALELSGKYDDAVKQLNYYLELKPSETDAQQTRAHITVIDAEKEAAAGKKQQDESVLAVRYVAGGATRLRYRDAPAWWQHSGGIDTLYTYTVPGEAPYYINVFRMPNSHFLVISLIAQSNNGMYAGDQIGVYDITDSSCIEGNDFAFAAQDYATACGGRYYVKVSDQPNATVTVTYPATDASVTLPVALLYRGRALKGQDWPHGDGKVHQGGARAMVLHFDDSVVKAAEDPTVNAAGLTPATVKPE